MIATTISSSISVNPWLVRRRVRILTTVDRSARLTLFELLSNTVRHTFPYKFCRRNALNSLWITRLTLRPLKKL